MKQPQFPSYFADAETDYAQARFVIFGVPYDKTSSFRFGSSQGPDAIRHGSWNFETFNLLTHKDFSAIPVHDYGNLQSLSSLHPLDMIKKITAFSKKVVSDNKIPICIGGEHSATAGIISSLPSDTIIIFLDAHLDYRDQYEQESFNHACTIRRTTEIMSAKQVIVLGVRSTEKTEYEQALQDNLTIIESLTILKNGISSVLHDIQQNIGNKKIYVSLDIDVIDPGFAPGTGTPEPFGLHPLDVCHVFDVFKENMIGFDIMEVNPLFDHGQTAMLAAKYVRYGIETIAK